MSAIFSSGCLFDKIEPIVIERGLNSRSGINSRSSFNPQFEYERINDVDFISATVFTLNGCVVVEDIVPLNTLPLIKNIKNDDICVSVCKAEFCLILSLLCLFSRFFWKSGSPYISPCDYDNLDILVPDKKTTIPCTSTCDERNMRNVFGRNCTTEPETTSSNTTNPDTTNPDTTNPNSKPCEQQEVLKSAFDVQEYIEDLKEKIHPCAVLTCNDKIITDLQCYLKAYKECAEDIFSTRTSAYNEYCNQPRANRNLYKLLTRGVDF
jgi:hypothetical protein